ncbi:OTU domain-containing protein [Amycolatopsis sp. MtRt-6]|uniref:OTU domain-containing protein n=1 Tax=Amycolatopsis sp. MtRt-6 TaxID=2792782 RepID=UPI001A8E4D25|nr:OTU domain-containing protein [Amycolatopsis sp. MtRt-6]
MFVHGADRPPNAEAARPDARPRAQAGPPRQPVPAAILAMQRSAGNVAVTRLVSAAVPVQRQPENTLFTEATKGARGARLTEDAYLAHVKNSIDESRPMAFIVNAILPYDAVDRIPAVVAAIVRGFSDGSRIAVVLGVNAPAGKAAQLDAKLAEARAIIEQLPLPVALVRSVFSGKFPYGTMRNAVLHSDECRRMTEAFAATGRHPYISVQDFDTGSRQVPGGRHVFDHFERRLGDREESTSSGDAGSPDDMATERPRPVRPLLAAGGYRLDSPDDALIGAVRAQYGKDGPRLPDELAEQPSAAQLAKRRAFLDRFKAALAEDMRQRDALAKIHPLLPYAPEPNLLLDALPNLLGPGAASAKAGAYPFAFGPKKSEFSALGQAVNQFNAWELSKRYSGPHESAPQASAVAATTPSDRRVYDISESLSAGDGPSEEFAPADHPTLEEDREDIQARVRADAENNRLPERGLAVYTDFVAGAIGTDLARLATGFLKDGKLPQNHVELTGVLNSFYASRGAKKDTSLARYRKGYDATAGYATEELLAPDGPRALPAEAAGLLGDREHNLMGSNVSAPLAGVFSGVRAGISPDHQLAASRELALATVHRTRFLATVRALLAPMRGTPMDGNCLYHAVNQARSGATDLGAAMALRQRVVDWMLADTNLENVATLAHDNGVDLPRLINTVATNGSWAGAAGDLAPTVVAGALGITVVIHLADGSAHRVGAGPEVHLDLAGHHYSVRPGP